MAPLSIFTTSQRPDLEVWCGGQACDTAKVNSDLGRVFGRCRGPEIHAVRGTD